MILLFPTAQTISSALHCSCTSASSSSSGVLPLWDSRYTF
nr:MAG TPA: hypothetical protein [Caudoviricetes sp.]